MTATEQLQAALLSVLCGLWFLGSGVLPTHSVVPYPPEVLQPLRSEALAAGSVDPKGLQQGNLAMGDKYNQSLAWDRILQDRLRQAEVPLWTRDIAGGIPFVPQMAQVYQPWNLLLLLVPSAGVYGIWYLLHMALFGFFAYRFLRRLQLAHTSSMFGMVTLILGLWTQAQVHHNVILTAALPAFAILSCVHQLVCVRQQNLVYMVLLALGTGLSWLAGFAPVSLQISYLAGAFALLLATRNPGGQRLRPLLHVAIAMAAGLCLASAQLIPVLWASAESSRLADVPTALYAHRALEWDHLWTLLWPDLLAWPADHFHGDPETVRTPWLALCLLDRVLVDPALGLAAFNYKETAFAVGLLPLLLALSTLTLRQIHCRFFAFAAAIGLLIALAAPGLLQLTAILPGARAGDLKRFTFLFALCVPVVAAFGAERFLRDGARPWIRRICGLVALVSGVQFLLHQAGPDVLTSYYGPWAEQTQGAPEGFFKNSWALPGEAAVNRQRLLHSFLFTFLVAGVGYMGFWQRNRDWTLRAFLLLTIVQLIAVGHGTVVPVPRQRVEQPPAVLQPVLESYRADMPRGRLQRFVAPPTDPNVWRIPVWPNMGAFYGVSDMGAYSPLPPRRMEEVFRAIEPDRKIEVPDKEPLPKVSVVLGGAGVSCFRMTESLRHPLLDLLGIEWILTNKRLDLPNLRDLTPAETPAPYHLYRRTTCLPRATFLGRALIETDKEERLRRLGDPAHDPRQVVILEDPDATDLAVAGASSEPATITIRAHRDEEVILQVENPKPGFLRLADPYDPGWRVMVNGEQRPVLVADHYLRAVHLPAGRHEVVFRFDGARVRWPQRLSLLSLLVLAAALILAWRRPGLLNTRAAPRRAPDPERETPA